MVASGAGAQVNHSSYALASSPLSGTMAAPAPNAQNVFMPAIFADPALLPASPAPEPQGIQGVFENYSWQAYAGYTFLRFYEVPGACGKSERIQRFGRLVLPGLARIRRRTHGCLRHAIGR